MYNGQKEKIPQIWIIVDLQLETSALLGSSFDFGVQLSITDFDYIIT